MHGGWKAQQHGKPCRCRVRGNRNPARGRPGRQGGGEACRTEDAGGNARRGKRPRVRRDDGGAKARGSGFAYRTTNPARRGREFRSITCVGEGAGLRPGAVRARTGLAARRRGAPRVKPCSFREPGHAKPLVPRVTGDSWKRLRTGVTCARCMIPLESRMREIRTSGSEGRGWKRAYGSRTEHHRASEWTCAPDPAGTAPPP